MAEQCKTPGPDPRITVGMPVPILDEISEALGTRLKTKPITREIGGQKQTGEFLPGRIWVDSKLFADPKKKHLIRKAIAHEIGHAIVYRFAGRRPKKGERANLLGKLYGMRKFLGDEFKAADGETLKNPVLTAELKGVSEWWRPFDATNEKLAAYRKKPDELFADAISVLLNNPEQLKQRAPNFTRALFTAWPTKHQQSFETYEELRDLMSGTRQELIKHLYDRWNESGERSIRRLRAVQDRQNPAFRLQEWIDASKFAARHPWTSFRGRLAKVWSGYVHNVHDTAHVLRKLARERGDVLPEGVGDAYMPAHDTFNDAPFMDAGPERAVAILDDAGVDPSREPSTIMAMDRIIAGDRSGTLNPRGITPDEAREIRDEAYANLSPAQAKATREAVDIFKSAHVSSVEAGIKAGIFTDDQRKQIEKNFDYVPFIPEEFGWRIDWKIYDVKGATTPINPSVFTLQAKDGAIRLAAHKNAQRKALLASVKAMAPDQVKKLSGGARWDGTRFWPKGREGVQGWAAVRLLEQGVKTDYQMPVALADAVMGYGSPVSQAPILKNGLDNARVIFRHKVVTLSIRFLTRAILMDAPLMFVANPAYKAWGAFQMMRDMSRALPDAIVRAGGIYPNRLKRTDWYKRMPPPLQAKFMRAAERLNRLAEKGLIPNISLTEAVGMKPGEEGFRTSDAAMQAIDELIRMTPAEEPRNEAERRRAARRQFGELMKMGWGMAKTPADFMESLAVMTNVRGLERAYGEDPAKWPRDLQVGLAKGELGVPFYARGGLKRAALNRYLAFWASTSNSAWGLAQGVRREWVAGGERRGHLMLKAALVSMPIVTGLAWKYGYVSRALLAMGADDDDLMVEWAREQERANAAISDFDRDNFNVLYSSVDEDGQGFMVSIPRSHELRALAMVMRMTLDAFVSAGDKDIVGLVQKAAAGLANQMISIQPAADVLIQGALVPVADWRVWDTFRGRFVYSEDEMRGLGAVEKAQIFASWTLDRMGIRRMPSPTRPAAEDWVGRAAEIPEVGPALGGYVRPVRGYGYMGVVEQLREESEVEEARRRVKVRKALELLRAEADEQLAAGEPPDRVRMRLANQTASAFLPELIEEGIAAGMTERQIKARRRAVEEAAYRFLAIGDYPGLIGIVGLQPHQVSEATRRLVDAGASPEHLSRFLMSMARGGLMSEESVGRGLYGIRGR